MKKTIAFITVVLVFLQLISAQALEQKAPKKITDIENQRVMEIESLQSRTTMFDEFFNLVRDNYKLISAGRQPDIYFFKHTISEEDMSIISGRDYQLLAIAARCNISYDTLATLNGIANAGDSLMGKTLLIPTVSGIFVKTEGKKNDLELLLFEKYDKQNFTKDIYWYKIDGEIYAFFLNERFSATERAYFLDAKLALPLEEDSFWISSEFGTRKNPFSGEWKNHNGIDLAAREGTPVHAVKDGTAAFCIENDSVFGNYIILSHDLGQMTSIYAHLSKMAVKQYAEVKKGDIIGYVGKTGMATGPHLHFEIRNGGVPEDPAAILKL